MSAGDRLSGAVRDALSVEGVKVALLRTAYGGDGLLGRRDPRVVLAWYLTFLTVPWFFFDLRVLGGLLAFVAVVAVLSGVNWLLAGFLLLSFGTSLAAYALAGIALGGGLSLALALLPYTLKLTTVSVASLAVFAGLDPDDLGSALVWLRAPRRFTFVVSYAYRLLPVLVEEYRDAVDAIRRRSPAPPESVLGWRRAVHLLGVLVEAFVPLLFDVAKRSRTTVEALEARGFSRALADPDARERRLAHLAVDRHDLGFYGLSLAVVAALVGAFVL